MAKTTNVLVALAAGLAVGVGVGVLFAPEKGKDTRKKIKDSVDDKTEKLKQQLDKLSRRVKFKTHQAKENLDERVENLLSDASYKVEDVITVLERKLASLKEANAKLQK